VITPPPHPATTIEKSMLSDGKLPKKDITIAS